MNSNYPPCPKCGERYYKVWKLTHPIVLHYVLNPGIAINEILLGQCLPKVTLICQTCQLPLYARGYVPCPHCRAMHDGRLWSKQNAFGNWQGFTCLTCGRAIPRLWNIFSLIILIVLAPIWYLPYRFLRQNRYQLRQRIRISNISEPTTKTWVFLSIYFSFFM